MDYQEIEGTWEEVLTHASELEGHHVRVTVLDADHSQRSQNHMPTKEDRIKALRALMTPLPDVPVLTDEAMSRETIYADRG